LASCLRRSGCPGVVLVGLIFTDLFDVGFLTTWFLTILIVLCTVHAPEARRGRVDRAASTQPILASGGQVDGRQLITEGR